MHFNLLDLGLVAVFAAAILDGLRRGFAPYATELLAFGAGLALALALFAPAGRLLHERLGLGIGIAGFGAFLMLLVAGHAVVQGPVQRLAAALVERIRPRLDPPVYRAVSVLPAAGVAGLLVAVGLSALVVLPGGGYRSLVAGSTVGTTIAGHADFIRSPLHDLLVPAARESNHILEPDPMPNPGEDAFYRLQFPADLVTELDVPAEDLMLVRLNRARREAGLSPLRLDPILQEAAREHSRDMYTRHYFSHTTPDHRSPYDRLRELRVHYVTAGENIAFAPDGDQAWGSLMHSPDHRANILNPDFRCLGIGVYRGLGGYEEMFTQDFADCS